MSVSAGELITDPDNKIGNEFHFHKSLQQMNIVSKHYTTLKIALIHAITCIVAKYCTAMDRQAVGARVTLLEVGVVGIIVKKLQH